MKIQLGLGVGRRASLSTYVPTITTLPAVSQTLVSAVATKPIVAGYTGRLATIRNTSGTIADLPASGSNADFAALASHVGTGTYTIPELTDQSGNGRSLTQSSAILQPFGRHSAALGELAVCIGFNADRRLSIPSTVSLDRQSFSAFLVVRQLSNQRPNAWVSLGDQATSYDFLFHSSDALTDFTLKGRYSTSTSLTPVTPAVDKGQALPGASLSVIGVVSSASGVTFYKDGKSYSASALPSGTMSLGGSLGWAHEAAYKYGGDILACVFYGGALSTAEVASVNASLKTIFRTTDPAPTQNFVFVGDSITEGIGATFNRNLPRILEDELASSTQLRNLGFSGATAGAFSTYANPFSGSRWWVTGATNVLHLWMGTNDLGGASDTAANTWTYLQSIVSAAKASNPTIKVILGTLLPRSDSAWDDTKEVQRLALNNSIRASVGTVCDAVADYANEITIGYSGTSVADPARASNVSEYTSDKLHPSEIGYSYVAGVLKQTLVSLGLATRNTTNITPGPLPLALTGTMTDAAIGVAYSFAPVAKKGRPPYSYSMTGTLPAGLSFNASTGAISGTPTGAEMRALTVTATDSVGSTASVNGTINVVAPLAFTSPAILGSWTFSNSNATVTQGTTPTAGSVRMNRPLANKVVGAVRVDAVGSNYFCFGVVDGAATTSGPGFDNHSVAILDGGQLWANGSVGGGGVGNFFGPNSQTASISGTSLTVTSGTGLFAGQLVEGVGVLADTYITGGAGTSWTVNKSQTVASKTLTMTTILGCLIDVPNNRLWFTKNGTLFYGASSSISITSVNAGTGGLAFKTYVPGSTYHLAVGSMSTASKAASVYTYPWTLPTGFALL
jgi:lysophospholipase L1-like esterase